MGHAAASGHCVATLLTAKKSCSLLKPACPLGLPCRARSALSECELPCVRERIQVYVCVDGSNIIVASLLRPLPSDVRRVRRLLAASDDTRLLYPAVPVRDRGPDCELRLKSRAANP